MEKWGGDGEKRGGEGRKGPDNHSSSLTYSRIFFCTYNLRIPLLSLVVSFHKSTFSSLEELKMILQMH